MASDDSGHPPITSPKAIEIQPSLSQLYPRLHLLGLPQELQDLIFDNVFDKHGLPIGAKKLRPLLTCRHIYHVTNVKAWAGTGFYLVDIAKQDLEVVKSTIPISIKSRKASGMMAAADDISMLNGLRDHLPRCGLVDIMGSGKVELQARSDRQQSADWHDYLLEATDLFSFADSVMFPAEAFAPKVVTGVIWESAFVQAARTSGLFNLEPLRRLPEYRIVHCKKPGSAEHYKVITGSRDAEPKAYEIVSCNTALEPQATDGST